MLARDPWLSKWMYPKVLSGFFPRVGADGSRGGESEFWQLTKEQLLEISAMLYAVSLRVKPLDYLESGANLFSSHAIYLGYIIVKLRV
jgi:hypothetical protein